MVNGVPRETTEAAPVTTGPGAPLAPGEVLLPSLSARVAGASGSTPPWRDPIAVAADVAFDAVSDTTVFTSAPNASQSPESAGLLAIGGPRRAVTFMSFDVTGIGDGADVFSTLLTCPGAGDVGAPGGSVGVIYDYVVPGGADG